MIVLNSDLRKPSSQFLMPKGLPEVNWTFYAWVQGIYDADTFYVIVDQGFGGKQDMKLRLEGVDAPEVSLQAGVTPEEKAKGLFMRDALRERMPPGTEIVLVSRKSYQQEKFGRYLVTVWDQYGNVNEWVKRETDAWLAGNTRGT